MEPYCRTFSFDCLHLTEKKKIKEPVTHETYKVLWYKRGTMAGVPFALQVVVRVMTLMHCLRVEFRHNFVFVRDTGTCQLKPLTFHQERLGLSIIHE